ncbi:MAG: glycoside hydrolase family 88 protein, partial [Pedobacter sp.]|uniref:glycoside hydrolase family 88 protein n=1 Tax=Pedobacter sp. TaxID=1411316 RepID=UPI003395C3AF
MNNTMKLNSTLFLALMITFMHSYAQKAPAKKSVLAAMESTNAYFMKKWPDPGATITTNTTRPSNIWTRAVYYEGLMSLHTVEPSKEYYDYAADWGEKHKWGLRGGVSTRNGDNQACGQTYIDLYNLDKQPERIKDIKESMDLMMKSVKIDDWTLIDAMQMGMPVFAKLGALYNDNAYYEYMYQMYM